MLLEVFRGDIIENKELLGSFSPGTIYTRFGTEITRYSEMLLDVQKQKQYQVMEWIDAMSCSQIAWGFGMSAYQNSGMSRNNTTPIWTSEFW